MSTVLLNVSLVVLGDVVKVRRDWDLMGQETEGQHVPVEKQTRCFTLLWVETKDTNGQVGLFEFTDELCCDILGNCHE